jgi:ABC-type glutathione transport system ATPase component
MTAPPLLAVRNLQVRYGDLIGVADLSFEVAPGSIVALLGSNGAGKTSGGAKTRQSDKGPETRDHRRGTTDGGPQTGDQRRGPATNGAERQG